MTELSMEIELLDYWHCGSGRGVGSLVDATIDRDDNGLPYIPGRMLKGLLRDATEALAGFESRGDEHATLLFGPRLGADDVDGNTNTRSRFDFAQGLLAFSDARLPRELAEWLRGQGARYAEQLTRTIASTALQDGVAKAQTLRSHDVAVPMTLVAHIGGPSQGDWIHTIRRAARFLHQVGAHRSRGLGRCEMRIKESGDV